MAIEIERKFLVNKEKWLGIAKPAGEFYRQGYLLTDPEKTIRVRLTRTSGFLTIKGISTGTARPEYEYEIPGQDAKELLDKFSVSELIKTRYKINHQGKIWEVDEYAGANAGLFIAEIELAAEHEHINLPDWVGEEVTGVEKYYNSSLTISPYLHWNL